jgi:hypothetical protein
MSDATATPIDFAGQIREGDVVVCGQATAEPRTLTEALVEQAAALPAFRMLSARCSPRRFRHKARRGCRS